ncbi:MAG TPA: hypothetical protein VFT53_04085 [Candidatus Saccharimonadales bacterium]|nr:hypothetical protein [Candidatus Saccharimonadales bacterium]
MERTAPETVKAKVATTYKELHKSLLELVSLLNILEPGGTLAEDVFITTREDGQIRIAYVATPVSVRIRTPEQTFILKVIEH